MQEECYGVWRERRVDGGGREFYCGKGKGEENDMHGVEGHTRDGGGSWVMRVKETAKGKLVRTAAGVFVSCPLRQVIVGLT